MLDRMTYKPSSRQNAIGFAIVGLTVGVAFGTVYLVGPITPEQSSRLNIAFGILVAFATVASVGEAVCLGLTRVRT